MRKKERKRERERERERERGDRMSNIKKSQLGMTFVTFWLRELTESDIHFYIIIYCEDVVEQNDD